MAQVRDLKQFSSNLFEISLERAGLEYRCGQWALLIHSDKVTARPYSFSSHPREQEKVNFFFRRYNEGFTVWLAERYPGQDVRIGVPCGHFCPGTKTKEVWVGIGTGIAPFVSALKGSCRPPAQLLYGAKSIHQAPFWPLFVSWPVAFLITQDLHCAEDRLKGYKEVLLVDLDSHYFLCGVPSVVGHLSTWLTTLGIQKKHIHVEAYAS